jgi:hypothetical protein
MTYLDLDVNGLAMRVYLYIVPNQSETMILGKPWIEDVDAILSPKRGYMDIHT